MASILALNLAWGSIAFAALLLLAFSELRRSQSNRQPGKWKRSAAVLLAICFLFPCVSASDDVLGLSTLWNGHRESQPPSKQAVHLDRVLQELENLRVISAFNLAIVLSCAGVISATFTRFVAVQSPHFTGRGPPAFFQ